MERILKLIDAYWKFDDNQQPLSSWHDKQDLLKAVEAEINCGSSETQAVRQNEDVESCGKSNCNRPKLDGNVYCAYHYEINFG